MVVLNRHGAHGASDRTLSPTLGRQCSSDSEVQALQTVFDVVYTTLGVGMPCSCSMSTCSESVPRSHSIQIGRPAKASG